MPTEIDELRTWVAKISVEVDELRFEAKVMRVALLIGVVLFLRWLWTVVH